MVVDDKAVLQTLVLVQVCGALLLHARAVEHVGARDDLGGYTIGPGLLFVWRAKHQSSSKSPDAFAYA